MSQLATIFEKIKEDFFENQAETEVQEKYKLIFSPFSTGFTYDDFLFLDSNSASENAQKYLDELLEFSQIANTIPRENNYWALSDHQDYLFYPYKNILDTLRLIDVETLNVKMFYKHSVFKMALDSLGEKSDSYKHFFKRWTELKNDIDSLDISLNDINKIRLHSEIKGKNKRLCQIETEWSLDGNKDEIEGKILSIIKDEFKRFLNKLIRAKGQLETLVRTHPGSGSDFYLTSCTPNNLYKGSELKWKKISFDKSEIENLLKKTEHKEYEDILGSEEFSKLEFESIGFELLFANVTRAWFDESILKSPFWDINVLNREDINIPRITSKLIFVRNVEFKASKNSSLKEFLLKKDTASAFGPFVLNTSNFQNEGKFRLHSINNALNIDRQTVLGVGAKLKKKANGGNTKLQINKKQQQFLKLSHRLKSSQRQSFIIDRKAKAPIRIRTKASFSRNAIPTTRVSTGDKNIKYKFRFKDRDDNSSVTLRRRDIYLAFGNREIQASASSDEEENHTFVFNLKAGNSYKLKVKTEGYKHVDFPFIVPRIDSNQFSEKIVLLENEVSKSQIFEAFQLIGVISKEIGPFPNPIKEADYV